MIKKWKDFLACKSVFRNNVLFIVYLLLNGEFDFNSLWVWLRPNKSCVYQPNLNKNTSCLSRIVWKRGLFVRECHFNYYKIRHFHLSEIEDPIQIWQATPFKKNYNIIIIDLVNKYKWTDLSVYSYLARYNKIICIPGQMNGWIVTGDRFVLNQYFLSAVVTSCNQTPYTYML